MKISFVIPAFNEEAYIGRCLESIIGEVSKHQADAEIIVVNNASTDKTAEVAKSYPGVKVVDEPRKSAVQARHTGYLNASGDLIAGIDADSALTPNWFSIVKKEFSSDQKLVGLSGPYIYDDVSKRLRRAIGIYYRIAFIVYFVMKFIFRTSSMMQGGNMVIRKSALDQLGGYDLSFSFYGDDTDLARRLHSLGNVKFISKLNVYSSGRRMMGEGIFLTGFRYATNYF
ncbi:MAG TPA: glycosyltransferase family 2 protein, partial [Candidatus Paceibacterota bacterium]|nr:glycosyltransferase family 2 protein [Candidatus Paceibacterota bacterium]